MLFFKRKYYSLSNYITLAMISLLSCSVFSKEKDTTCALPKIKGIVNLNKNCIYQGPLIITEDNVVLNCEGAMFNGENKRGTGIIINAEGKGAKNIKIHNCRITNYTYNGIRIASGTAANKLNENHEINYKNSVQNVLIDNVEVSNIERVGIYLEAYVTNITIKNSTINKSGGVGIYLDQASRNNKIISNKLMGNGILDPRHAREAIAVDSSANNIIQDNTFQGNGLGSIFLYKNCGEKFSSGKSVLRWQHSDNNIINENIFLNEKVGIWISSRQSYDLKNWDCGDKPMDSIGRYYEDFSNNNKIEKNKFCKIPTPIRVEGDNNKIINNFFDEKNAVEVEIPTSMREKLLGKKAVGNVINGSKKINCT